jgi:glycosyltransferase involved in cell wall biosynthesis/GT2 family glycosyltransferase
MTSEIGTMSIVKVEDRETARKELTSHVGPVILVPLYGAFDDAIQCFESILRTTSSNVPLLIIEDCSGDIRAIDALEKLTNINDRKIVVLMHSVNTGFIGSCNDGFYIANRNDVIVVNSDVVVTAGWFEGLCQAAQSSNLVATVTSLTNHGTAVSIPLRNISSPQLPGSLTPEVAAQKVRDMSLKLYPTLPTAIGHCMYIRRVALDVVGDFDTVFGKGYSEEVDFSQRAVRAGFKHICADDVFVYHRGGGSFGNEMSETQLKNDFVVRSRYPWYEHWVDRTINDWYSPLSVALKRASISLVGLTVAIDGRCLGPILTGTQQNVLETVKTLCSNDAIGLVNLYVSDGLPSYADTELRNLPKLKILEANNAPLDARMKSDIAYRPYQVSSSSDIEWLRARGHWMVINQLDVIAFNNASYFPSYKEWLEYRRLTALSLNCADGVTYISEHAQREVHAEGLSDAQKVEKVVYCGTDFVPIEGAVAPQQLSQVKVPFMVVLGASYHHKNRGLALQTFAEMRRRGWVGKLVLVGPTPPTGNSLGTEALEFLEDPSLREDVIQIGSIAENEKAWLLRNSCLLLYPTTVEGFGLVPFEASAYGLPTLSSRQGSLDEVLPRDIPTIVDFLPQQIADQAMAIINDPKLGEKIVTSIRSQSAKFNWKDTGSRLVDVFTEVISRPPVRTVGILGEDRRVVTSLAITDDAVLVTPKALGPKGPGKIVKSGSSFPLIKRIISKDGSRRQKFLRRMINKMR